MSNYLEKRNNRLSLRIVELKNLLNRWVVRAGGDHPDLTDRTMSILAVSEVNKQEKKLAVQEKGMEDVQS